MAKFDQIVQGSRSRKTVPFPLDGTSYDFEKSSFVGETKPVDVRALSMGEEIAIDASALSYARVKGVADPGPGDPLFDRARMLHTVLAAYVDNDAPHDSFFGSVEQVESLHGDVVAYLYEHQRVWQEEVSPRKSRMSIAEFQIASARTAVGDMSPFLSMQFAMQWSFTHTLARQLASSPSASLPFGSSSKASDKPS